MIAEERGAFTIDDVARDITAKMHRRNPHVFGEPGPDRPQTAAEVNEVWEQIKAQEKKRTSASLPETLPALLYATKALERGATRARGPRAGTTSATGCSPWSRRPPSRASTRSRRCGTPYAASPDPPTGIDPGRR